ncbi:hypothetical protein [Singulisphaera acidiphila]|uniref:Uncharacterized protein n=1 Tax=Singulisphaera acidiphila (strain ATCC BAA-1392 / DSM 18658 / VKM B-2454 / MOB10) TaxID=886293 RepID=L0DDC1_SINAD|nr:hypothetical protein [Singulisphaera acidiphila]AGA26666.1 hypothetical protein Sinac_2354 [Singulisphaera acidiphila DSM 18658]
MSPSPRLLMTLIVILSTVLGLTLVVLAWVVAQLRRQPISALVKSVDDLRTRQDHLEAMMEKAGSARQAEPAPQGHPGPPLRRPGSRSRRVDAAEPTAVSGPTLIAVPSLATASLPSSAAVGLDLGRRFSPIWDLADTGATPDAIARSTGQPIGQVELILALRRQLNANAGEPRLT